MAYTGVRSGAMTSVNSLAANQMPDVDKVLYQLKPYQTPIMQWLYFSNKNAEVVINENGKFSWFEDELYPHQTTVTNITGSAASEDNITVGDGTIFNEGDIIFIESSEQVAYVDSIASGEVDITHIDGTTNLTAVTSGYIKIIGSRNHEFATARTAVSTQEVEKYNYSQIFSETVTTSGRYQAGEKYTNGKKHAEQVQKKIEEMKFQVERNFLFSTARGTATVSTNYRHTYGYGALGLITTNKTSFAGTLGEDAFDAYLKKVFQKGSNRKKHFVGGDQLVQLNKFMKDKYEINTTDGSQKSYGSQMTSYVTPFGIVDIVYDPVMDGKFSYYGLTLDVDNVKVRYMDADEKGARKFRIEENVQTPGTDGKSTKLLMDMGLQITNEETCGWLYPAS